MRKVRGEAKLYHGVRLWEQGTQQVNLVVAYPKGVAEPWVVMTDEPPSLNTGTFRLTKQHKLCMVKDTALFSQSFTGYKLGKHLLNLSMIVVIG